MSKGKVSKAKSYGVKSMIIAEDVLYTTSFGERSKADVEYILDKEEAEILPQKRPNHNKYDLTFEGDKLKVSLKKSFTFVPNPFEEKEKREAKFNEKVIIGEDYAGLKNKLEERFYGKNFNDNLHIQIIYNILDIYKCLALYCNEIVYSLNNLERGNKIDLFASIPDYVDLIDYNKTNFFEYYEAVKNNLYLFEDIFNKDESGNYVIEDVYDTLRIVSYFRQMVAHYDYFNNNKLIDLENTFNEEKYKTLKVKLDSCFSKTIYTIQKDFATNSKNNIRILSEFRRTNDYQSLYKKYFEYSMFKDYKNIGVNLKTIREKMITQLDFDEERLNKNRRKLNFIIDFEIYSYLTNPSNKSELISYIDELRKCGGEENKKDDVYNKISNELLEHKKSFYASLNVVEKVMTDKLDIPIEDISNEINPSMFSKLIFFISKLLEPKEMNDLYTKLINKFDNIQSLIDMENYIEKDLFYNYKEKFAKSVSLFTHKKPGEIADELRLCKNFSHMNQTNKKEKNQKYSFSYNNYKDALSILGCNKDIIENEVQWLCSLDMKDSINKNDRHLKLKNFIDNNIIKSKRYKYIIKYADPLTCLNYIRNEVIVNYLLNVQLDDSLIIKYYKSCTGDEKEVDLVNARKILGNIIKEFNYENLKSNEEVIIAKKDENDNTLYFEQVKLKNIIGLVLTMLYLVCKNLVNINAVYFIAFNCFDRDYNYLIDHKYNVYTNKTCFDLLDLKLSKMKKHVPEYLSLNMKSYLKMNCKKELFKEYRNCVEHLNVLTNGYKYLDNFNDMKSYYDLYQYLLQKYLIKTCDVKGYEAYSKSYSKDLCKYINAPFEYNLARYKNLTIADLFNDKYNKDKE